MYRRFHDRFGTAGVLLGVIALVLAIVTGAYAAGGGLSGKQKKEVEKIAKKYAGKPGTPGAVGANGTSGTNGKDGTNGTPGKDGTNGENVEVNAYTGGECHGEGEEGAELTNKTGTAYACNGAEGSPWTAGGTLPSGKTETGHWAVFAIHEFEAEVATFSFAIPLANPLAANSGHWILPNGKEYDASSKTEVDQTVCLGSVAEPIATEGNLCVYTDAANGFTEPFEMRPTQNLSSVSTTGTFSAFVSAGAFAHASGSWAVTSE